ncbi:MAG: DUF945 family protein [Pseudomonadales bacterium]|nr:DUF945 family protein [Pseudomonadales bacterium]MCP5331343.1 DUF945 family protein [Pseudomonadales bacterium]MCP5344353.1 DUF945 family protein [Pseudomonadales bacterium]
MKRLVVILLSLLLLVVALMPLIVGSAINNEEQLEQLRQRLGQPGMVLELERGWFRTTGVVTVSDPFIGQRRHPGVRFTAPVSIQHGPLLWSDAGLMLGYAYGSAQPRLEGPVDDPLFHALLSSATPPQVSVHAQLNGDIDLHWSNDTLYYETPLQTLTAENFDLRLTATADLALNAQLQADKVRGSSAVFGKVEADSPALNIHSGNPEDALLPASLQLTLPRLHIDAAEQLTLHGIRIDYAAHEEADTHKVSVRQQVQVEQIDSRAPLSALLMDSRTQGIDIEVFRRLRALLGNIRNSDPDELQAVLLQLQQKPATQHTDATLTLWGGKHRLALDLNWPGMPGLSDPEQLTASQVLRVLDASMHLRANIDAVERSFVAIMARNYAAQGMLPTDNGDYVLDMTLQGGTLNVNGQSIDLAPFLNLLNQMNR